MIIVSMNIDAGNYAGRYFAVWMFDEAAVHFAGRILSVFLGSRSISMRRKPRGWIFGS